MTDISDRVKILFASLGAAVCLAVSGCSGGYDLKTPEGFERARYDSLRKKDKEMFFRTREYIRRTPQCEKMIDEKFRLDIDDPEFKKLEEMPSDFDFRKWGYRVVKKSQPLPAKGNEYISMVVVQYAVFEGKEIIGYGGLRRLHQTPDGEWHNVRKTEFGDERFLP